MNIPMYNELKVYVEFYCDKGMIYGREINMIYNRHNCNIEDKKNNEDSIYLSFTNDKIVFETTELEDIFIRIKTEIGNIEPDNKYDFRLNKLITLRDKKTDIKSDYLYNGKLKYTIKHIRIPKIT